jgi:hypothetical protein
LAVLQNGLKRPSAFFARGVFQENVEHLYFIVRGALVNCVPTVSVFLSFAKVSFVVKRFLTLIVFEPIKKWCHGVFGLSLAEGGEAGLYLFDAGVEYAGVVFHLPNAVHDCRVVSVNHSSNVLKCLPAYLVKRIGHYLPRLGNMSLRGFGLQ